MAIDVGCERIHKEKKMHRAKSYSLFKGGKELGTEKCTSIERLGL